MFYFQKLCKARSTTSFSNQHVQGEILSDICFDFKLVATLVKTFSRVLYRSLSQSVHWSVCPVVGPSATLLKSLPLSYLNRIITPAHRTRLMLSYIRPRFFTIYRFYTEICYALEGNILFKTNSQILLWEPC